MDKGIQPWCNTLLRRLVVLTAALLSVFVVACEPVASQKELEAGLAAAPQPTFSALPDTDVTVKVQVLETGNWSVEYAFSEPQNILGFDRSIGDYRRGTWGPEPGTPSIERVHETDILVFDTPVQSARFEVEPYDRRLPRDYTPFLKLSNGEGAIFLQQFRVSAFENEEAVKAARNGDKEARKVLRFGARIHADQPMVLDGEVHTGMVEYIDEEQGQSYVYVGDLSLEQGTSYIGIIDPNLPVDIQSKFDSDLATIFAEYERLWGFSLPERATVYFAFGGTERRGLSLSGSVAGGNTLVLTVSGARLLDPDAETRRRIMQFFAHEAAHMFEGAKGVPIGSNRQAWWHEGSADAMAYDLLIQLDLTDNEHLLTTYRRRINECSVGIERQPLIGNRGDYQYVCGDLIANIAASALPDHSIYDIWNAFLDRADDTLEDQEIDDLFLQTLKELGTSDNVVAALKSLIQDRQDNGRTAILKAFEAAGISYELDRYGSLSDLTLP